MNGRQQAKTIVGSLALLFLVVVTLTPWTGELSAPRARTQPGPPAPRN
jgi:hypothetical protein